MASRSRRRRSRCELKSGSRATPISPRSQVLSTSRVTNGSGRSVPSLTTRSVPVCSQTKIRPSGATASAVAPVIPVAIRSLEKPGGRVIGPVMPLPGVPIFAARSDLEVGDQVGEVRGRQPRGQPVGHHRHRAGPAVRDLGLGHDDAGGPRRRPGSARGPTRRGPARRRTRPSAVATTSGRYPSTIWREGSSTDSISRARSYLPPTSERSGPMSPPLPPRPMAPGAAGTLGLEEQLATAGRVARVLPRVPGEGHGGRRSPTWRAGRRHGRSPQRPCGCRPSSVLAAAARPAAYRMPPSRCWRKAGRP